jgi:hypothetical protein
MQVSRTLTSHVSHVKQLVNVIICDSSFHLIAISVSVPESFRGIAERLERFCLTGEEISQIMVFLDLIQ